MPSWRVIVLSSDTRSRESLAGLLLRQGMSIACASTIRECQELLCKEAFGAVFCDRELSDGTYRDVLRALRSARSKTQVVLTSCQAEWDEYLEAIRSGAFDVIATPFQRVDVEWMVMQVMREAKSVAA